MSENQTQSQTQSEQQKNIEFQYGGYEPLRTVIAVYKVDDNGKKSEWFKGLLTERTSRGLMLIPVDGEYGTSTDPLAASFLAYPEYQGNKVEFRVSKRAN